MNLPPLAPLPYHCEIRDYLKAREPDLWRWFASAHARENYAEALRLSLLKSTYRLRAEDHPELHAHLATAAAALGLDLPLQLYQAQNSSGQPNAAIYSLPDQAHLVLSGPLASLLAPGELVAVFGHELAHHVLWHLEDAEFLIADRALHAMADDPAATGVHLETCRQYRLHTEILADRGSILATRDLPTVVSALVKIETGLTTVSAESYRAQAEEIFAGGEVQTAELSHPECFIRTRALDLWAQSPVPATDRAVRAMIAGRPALGALDLTAQVGLTALTRRFLQQLLRPRWFQTDTVLAHARLFFADFVPATTDDATLVAALQETDQLLEDYFSYLLLDFAHADRDLDDTPTAAALDWAERLGIAPRLEKLLTKEFGLKARDLAKLKSSAADLLRHAEAGA